MFNVGGGEVLVILVLALVVLGPDKLPEAARTFGKHLGDFRRISGGFRDEIANAMSLQSTAPAAAEPAPPPASVPTTPAAPAPAATTPPSAAARPATTVDPVADRGERTDGTDRHDQQHRDDRDDRDDRHDRDAVGTVRADGPVESFA
jgi:sec-independent protein translocase protein TatB